MKVSNKILTKLSLITIVLVFIVTICILAGVEIVAYTEYLYRVECADDEDYLKQNYNTFIAGYFTYYNNLFDSKENISYEEFKLEVQNDILTSAKSLFRWISIRIIPSLVCIIILFIPVLILIIKYFKRTNKLIRHIKEYRDYMVSTNNYKIEDISKEFNEEPRIVETTIQKAINKHILKNVYLSKQTKEVLLVNKTPSTKSIKGNQQNVSVENNVIINDKSE